MQILHKLTTAAEELDDLLYLVDHDLSDLSVDDISARGVGGCQHRISALKPF